MRILFSSPVRSSALTLAAICVALLAGCASKPPVNPASGETAAADSATGSGVQTVKSHRFLGIFSPYRINIQQGNFISKEMISQITEGMTTDQVTFALGTPLLTDMFHANRWDYVFRMQKGNGEVTSSRVTIFFQDGKVAKIEGGENLPTESEYLARISGDLKGAQREDEPEKKKR
ncbi:outer membrane protein assembly factor BamE [Glaciimonas soli]|uniref:Outer membrane protein assembly factor BamE n=1 Tax=Glaciimonas soli TaxID=2590999 RepID=A0A843YW10_9BURK|nr:outer membrane protein assembly factor BamE [Glaciimonas soli]MQR02167.1 outer membrane protein assembly factor BamE [Glaciimonas soli]